MCLDAEASKLNTDTMNFRSFFLTAIALCPCLFLSCEQVSLYDQAMSPTAVELNIRFDAGTGFDGKVTASSQRFTNDLDSDGSIACVQGEAFNIEAKPGSVFPRFLGWQLSSGSLTIDGVAHHAPATIPESNITVIQNGSSSTLVPVFGNADFVMVTLTSDIRPAATDAVTFTFDGQTLNRGGWIKRLDSEIDSRYATIAGGTFCSLKITEWSTLYSPFAPSGLSPNPFSDTIPGGTALASNTVSTPVSCADANPACIVVTAVLSPIP